MTETEGTDPWLPDDFDAPERVELATGHHLRHVRTSDVDLHLAAVTSSRDRLWEMYGDAWGWPSAATTREEELEDLEQQVAEMAARESFAFALLDEGETQMLGCVYVEPSPIEESQAEISWWVVDRHVGTPLEREVQVVVPHWVREAWPFEVWNYLAVDET